MSVAATRYALDVLRHDPTLPGGARNILLATAGAASSRTAETYTGEWLEAVCGLCRSSVWRNFLPLVERGYVALDHRPGRASVVRFPIDGAAGIEAVEGAPRFTPPPAGHGLASGRTDHNGQFHPAICACPDCRPAALEA